MVIQLYYFVIVQSYSDKSLTSGSNATILISLIFSIYNVSSKMISEDRVFFDQEWRNWEITPFENEYNCTCCCCCQNSHRQVRLCFNPRYLARFLLRILDFAYRVSLILLFWLMVGGFGLTIYLSFEWIALIIIAIKAKRFVLSSFFEYPCTKKLFFLFVCFLFCVLLFVFGIK